MAEFQHKNGSFSLFKNSYKTEGDNKPDYKGKGKDLGGLDIEVAAWLRDGKDGTRWLSCQFKLKGAEQSKQTPAQDALAEAGEPEPKAAPQNHFSNMQDDVPFAPISRGIAGHIL